MSAFEIIQAAVLTQCIVFFIVIILDNLKPGMNYTRNLYTIWFYATFLLFGYMAYSVKTTGMI